MKEGRVKVINNWNPYGHKVHEMTGEEKCFVCGKEANLRTLVTITKESQMFHYCDSCAGKLIYERLAMIAAIEQIRNEMV